MNLGELLYGAAKRASARLEVRIQEVITRRGRVFAFDRRAAHRYAHLRAGLERDGERLDEPDLRIASIALARDLTVVTGNMRHFERVPGLRVENWLVDGRDGA